MAARIELPECVRRVVGIVYPEVRLEGVRFYDGLPWYWLGRRARAITIGSSVYFRAGAYDPCRAEGVALLVHEVCHVRQGSGGFGFWFLRWFYLKYVWLWATSGFRRGRTHPLEGPAYAAQDLVRECAGLAEGATGQAGPCACQGGSPTGVSEAFLGAFGTEWGQRA